MTERLTPAEYKALIAPKKPGRYGGNKRVTTDTGTFDSKGEHARWNALLARQARGELQDLERQVPFPFELNGLVICTYKADFVYRHRGVRVVEDFKGKIITPEFKLKQKMMRAFYGIDIKIVKKANADIG